MIDLYEMISPPEPYDEDARYYKAMDSFDEYEGMGYILDARETDPLAHYYWHEGGYEDEAHAANKMAKYADDIVRYTKLYELKQQELEARYVLVHAKILRTNATMFSDDDEDKYDSGLASRTIYAIWNHLELLIKSPIPEIYQKAHAILTLLYVGFGVSSDQIADQLYYSGRYHHGEWHYS